MQYSSSVKGPSRHRAGAKAKIGDEAKTRQGRSSRAAARMSVEFDGIERKPIHYQIYVRMKRQIMSGTFEPGQMFSMQFLAEALGTSKMPVREALRLLAAERAIEVRPKRAVRIPRVSRAKFVEISEARVLLEGLVAKTAAATITDAEIRSITQINQRADEALSRLDFSSYMTSNLDFHFSIYRASRSEVIFPFIESLWLQAGPTIGLYIKKGGRISANHHKQAIAALTKRNGNGARLAIAADIRAGLQFLLDKLPIDDH
jgi:DNA-binding GntR family transcriptional regulator